MWPTRDSARPPRSPSSLAWRLSCLLSSSARATFALAAVSFLALTVGQRRRARLTDHQPDATSAQFLRWPFRLQHTQRDATPLADPSRRRPASSSTTANRSEATASGPTISPYLNLFRDERGSTDEVPSYYTFVRPQMEQQAAYHRAATGDRAAPAAGAGRAASAGPTSPAPARRPATWTPPNSTAVGSANSSHRTPRRRRVG